MVLRLFVATFFIFEGLGRLRWFTDASILATELEGWSRALVPGSISARYLGYLMPHSAWLARLVPLGEIVSGLAMLVGFWTPLFAFIAFLMVLNYQIASGLLFQYRFLANGHGLPLLGATLALTIGGVRLPLSVR